MKMRASSPFAALLLALTAPAWALKSDRDQPMDIRSDRGTANANQGTATLTGNVHITQGTLEIHAGSAVVTQNDQQQVARAVLTGTPATLSEDLDEGGRLDAAATQIIYDMSAKQIVLEGNATIKQPRGELRGERITYDMESGRLDAVDPEGGNRVFLRMNPQDKKAPAKPPASDKPSG